MTHSGENEEQFWAAIGIRPDAETYMPRLQMFISVNGENTSPGPECDECGEVHNSVVTVELTHDAALTTAMELIKSAQVLKTMEEAMGEKSLEEREEIISLYSMLNDSLDPEAGL